MTRISRVKDTRTLFTSQTCCVFWLMHTIRACLYGSVGALCCVVCCVKIALSLSRENGLIVSDRISHILSELFQL